MIFLLKSELSIQLPEDKCIVTGKISIFLGNMVSVSPSFFVCEIGIIELSI